MFVRRFLTCCLFVFAPSGMVQARTSTPPTAPKSRQTQLASPKTPARRSPKPRKASATQDKNTRTQSTKSLILAARRSLGTGRLSQMALQLKQAEKALQREQKKLQPQVLDNYALWLHLLWSKYYRIKGLLPRFIEAGQFENKEHVRKQQDKLQQAMRFLKRSHYHLNRYNARFRRVLERSSLRDAMTLVSTTSQANDLRNTIQIVQNRASILELIARTWDRHFKKGQKPAEVDRKTFERQRQKVAQIQASQKRLKGLLGRYGRTIARSQKMFQDFNQDLQGRRRSAKTVTWVGLGGLLLGVGLGGASLGVYLEADRKDAKGDFVHTPQRTVELRNIAFGLLIAGGVLAVAGGSAMLFGALFAPNQKQSYDGVYKSHKHYLDWEDQQRKPASQSRTHYRNPALGHLRPPPSAPAHARTMGTWSQ